MPFSSNGLVRTLSEIFSTGNSHNIPPRKVGFKFTEEKSIKNTCETYYYLNLNAPE